MTKLTGEQRIQIVVVWIRKGGNDFMDKEEFIKKVCTLKGIEYVEPPDIKKK